jgi:hypothetical protein
MGGGCEGAKGGLRDHSCWCWASLPVPKNYHPVLCLVSKQVKNWMVVFWDRYGKPSTNMNVAAECCAQSKGKAHQP